METRRQFLLTIRIDAENSEETEYFTHEWADGRITLDLETLSNENHEVIEWEEIDQDEDRSQWETMA